MRLSIHETALPAMESWEWFYRSLMEEWIGPLSIFPRYDAGDSDASTECKMKHENCSRAY
ncbi:hypothetical protein FGG79_02825 [Bacillus sp. BHET2]|uniref:hypothetical protein n=1 Tax=Bacillus sp. BHET2 TaxID=2583818 RepID=UPI00110E550E|nr:hypothetical protein [Bacillus sp. BHET2]TMU87090.1 hypothetical protein FGG79_02825 [Bacillus sp. BHET2]